MHLLVLSSHRISVMYGQELFKIYVPHSLAQKFHILPTFCIDDPYNKEGFYFLNSIIRLSFTTEIIALTNCPS